MKATIITIGDELLIGQVVDTNSAWLATELTKIGFSVENHVSISDSGAKIENTLDIYLPGSDLLILTGGLGPTKDDITKKVLAHYFDTELIKSEEILADVETRIRSFGSTMNDFNREQAIVPKAAKILRNNYGTAPGMWFEAEGKVVISLPGVPSEMKGIIGDHISEIADFFALPQIIYKTIMVTGIPEAHLAEKLAAWEDALPNYMSLAYLPSPEAIRLRLGAKGDDKAALTEQISRQIEALQKIIPDNIFGYDNDSIELVVGRIIEQRGAYLACAESCTGGSIAQKITALPGCSAWFRGGVVAYSNEIKSSVLGVDEEIIERFGAVSEETVTEMVRGAQRVFDSEYAVATSGIAGPSGGTDDKPVGTVWIAAAGPDFLVTRKFTFGTIRAVNIRRSSYAAFNLLRSAILNN